MHNMFFNDFILYRHFDLARVYGNEIELGHVISDNIKNGVVKREELFLVNKVYNNEQERVIEVVEDSLKKLNLEYKKLIS